MKSSAGGSRESPPGLLPSTVVCCLAIQKTSQDGVEAIQRKLRANLCNDAPAIRLFNKIRSKHIRIPQIASSTKTVFKDDFENGVIAAPPQGTN